MEGIAGGISEVVAGLLHRDNGAPGDYMENGIRMCGKCRTPKQARVQLPKPDGGMATHVAPITCACEGKELARQEARFQREQFDFHMEALREKYDITDRAYRGLTFEKDDRREPKLSDTCRRYVEQWPEMKHDNIGMLFYGTVGTGKSFYACAVANALLERCVSAAVTNFPRLLNLLQSSRERQTCIDHLQRYQLLVIDDLGVERDSPYAAEQVFNVIDARARSGLPLIVTTNLTMDELKDPPSMQYARIYDRVLELCPVIIKMTGESRRIGNAAQRKAKAREILGGLGAKKCES